MASNTNRTRTQIHMLPTNGKDISMLSKRVKDGMLQSANGTEGVANCNTMWQPQHLYFTTDEEIKEGDWYLDGTMIPKNNLDDLEYQLFGKIIASTDPKLTVKYDNGVRDFGWETKSISYKKLPQPSQAFIKAYCEQGGFDWVDVEYTTDELRCYKCNKSETDCINTSKNCIGFFEDNNKVKVDPVHNTITTHRIVEKMYSLKEMEDIHVFVVKQGCLYEEDIWSDEHEKLVRLEFNEWIKEKL